MKSRLRKVNTEEEYLFKKERNYETINGGAF